MHLGRFVKVKVKFNKKNTQSSHIFLKDGAAVVHKKMGLL